MFNQIKNKEGKELYLLVVTSTNDIHPFTYAGTWEDCLSKLNQFTKEMDTPNIFQQLIHKEIEEEYHRANASMRCNKKGWGSDFFKYLTIESLYASNC